MRRTTLMDRMISKVMNPSICLYIDGNVEADNPSYVTGKPSLGRTEHVMIEQIDDVRIGFSLPCS